jgi:hypothetical protein
VLTTRIRRQFGGITRENTSMRTLTAFSLSVLALTAATAMAGQIEYGNGVFSPEKQVICDREGNWCADGTGISASWTEQYLGAEAAAKLVNVDQSEFVFHNGVHCVIATQSCSRKGQTDKASKKIQKMLFGG